MTVALNSVTSTPAYTPYVAPASGRVGAFAARAVGLSAEAAVVATLGGATGVTVYTPSGLLDSLRLAGTLAQPASLPEPGSDTSATALQAQNQGILATLTSTPATSGVYTGAGGLDNGLSSLASSNWADILKDHPSLAGTVIAASFNSGLVGSLSVTA